jgi:hypothetical protein
MRHKIPDISLPLNKKDNQGSKIAIRVIGVYFE